nr:hypothetical protein [uncultured bacterium]
MTYLRGRSAVLAAISFGIILSGCAKAEPDLPTSNPKDEIRLSEGWKVGRGIAVSPGKDEPKAHHVQAITSGWHDIDFETPPASLTAVKPSCDVYDPGMGGGKYLLLAGGGKFSGPGAKFPLMKNLEVPGLMAFSDKLASDWARNQAENMIEKGRRKHSRQWDFDQPHTKMVMRDVFITNNSESLNLALAGGGMYNFHMAPGVVLSSIVVYSYGEGAAVAGVPDHVPVSFVSKAHQATKRCWTRIQARPDKSWRRAKSEARDKRSRYNAVMPHWKEFQKRVSRDIGKVPEENVVSVNYTGNFLIGPPPTRYEDRIPYVAFGGKPIRYMTADHVRFGTGDDNWEYLRSVVDQYYDAFLVAAAP